MEHNSQRPGVYTGLHLHSNVDLKMDDPVLEDITNLKEPHGSKRIAIAMQIEEQYLTPPNLEGLLAAYLKLMTDDGILIKVKYQDKIAPSSPSRDVKTSPLLLDAKKDSPEVEKDGNEILTSPLLLDGKKYPPKAETNGDKVFTSLLLLDEKEDALRAENNGNKALTKAGIDAELGKMRNMTPQEAAAAAAQAVKEAEAAIAEAEEAVMEAEDAEREAEAAEAFAKAVHRALKWKKLRTCCSCPTKTKALQSLPYHHHKGLSSFHMSN